MTTLTTIFICIYALTMIISIVSARKASKRQNKFYQELIFEQRRMFKITLDHYDIYERANSITADLSKTMTGLFRSFSTPDEETSTLEDLEKQYEKAMQAGDIEKAIELGRMIDRKKNNQ